MDPGAVTGAARESLLQAVYRITDEVLLSIRDSQQHGASIDSLGPETLLEKFNLSIKSSPGMNEDFRDLCIAFIHSIVNSIDQLLETSGKSAYSLYPSFPNYGCCDSHILLKLYCKVNMYQYPESSELLVQKAYLLCPLAPSSSLLRDHLD